MALDRRYKFHHRHNGQGPIGHKEGSSIGRDWPKHRYWDADALELFAGVAQSRKPEEEKSKIITTLSSISQLSLDSPSASAGGLIYGEKMRTGRTIDPEDAMIAGIAKVNAEKVLTRNTKHFSDIDGVNVENY